MNQHDLVPGLRQRPLMQPYSYVTLPGPQLIREQVTALRSAAERIEKIADISGLVPLTAPQEISLLANETGQSTILAVGDSRLLIAKFIPETNNILWLALSIVNGQNRILIDMKKQTADVYNVKVYLPKNKLKEVGQRQFETQTIRNIAETLKSYYNFLKAAKDIAPESASAAGVLLAATFPDLLEWVTSVLED